MSRAFNFGAGPAALPLPVLERARDELLDWRGAGLSIMEMSHRGAEFRCVAEHAQARLRALLDVPESHAALFLQGGAQLQFAAVPLNLLGGRASADYVDTGHWSGKAIEEARRYARVNVVATAGDTGYRSIPLEEGWRRDQASAYLHYTPNETIGGVEFHHVPDAHDVPLVADMSSDILSRPVPVERFGLIYAGAQKNAGIAGLTIVIIDRGLLGRAHALTPKVLDYLVQDRAGSMANTAPTFAWYVAGLVFDWLDAQGGMEAMEETNRRKARTLYECIDASDFYRNEVDLGCRSRMNVPFALADPALDGDFLAEAHAAGLLGLKGHRSVGGMRASLYNAVPQAGVDALVEFMRDFEKRRG